MLTRQQRLQIARRAASEALADCAPVIVLDVALARVRADSAAGIVTHYHRNGGANPAYVRECLKWEHDER